MTSSLPPVFQRAKEAMRRTSVDRSLAYEAQDMAWDAMDAQGAQKLLLAQEALEYYPYCTDAWGVLGYHYLNDDKNFQASVEAFETGVEAARRADPTLGPDRTKALLWGNHDNRPYLRAMRGLARAYAESGQFDRALETAELLVRWKDTALLSDFAGWYMKAARWEDARRLLQEKIRECKEQDYSIDCGVAYAWVLTQYYCFQQGLVDSEKDLYEALEQALSINIHVPRLLRVDGIGDRDRPMYISPGDEDEALGYAIDGAKLWRSMPEAMEWLASIEHRDGPKPNEESFIRLLRRQLLYVEFSNRPAERITQNKEKMIGTALAEFRMPPGSFDPHLNGSAIFAQKHEYGNGMDDLNIRFQYDDVVSVPFWSVFGAMDEREEEEERIQQEENRERDRQERERKRRKRQKRKEEIAKLPKIWNELNSQIVSDITSFLSVKEKAAVRSYNKAWLKGSTLDKKVTINPDEVGTNVDGAIRFIASSFPNLQQFTLEIDQRYFLDFEDGFSGLGWGEDEHTGPLQLSGESLRSLFEQESICLRSVQISFDDCVDEHTFRILVSEEGLSTLSQQVSLRKLSLVYPYFSSIESLSHMIQPLINLRYLSLVNPNFPIAEYEHDDRDELWRNGSQLMAAIGSLPNLRTLKLRWHGLADDDLHGLSTLPDLRELELESCFGGRSDVSLTDASLTFIASTFRNLEGLSVCYNRRITVDGLRKVIQSCPLLEELQASDCGLLSTHLEEFVRTRPSLRFIRYAGGYGQQSETPLRKAAIASQGRCVFASDVSLYEPKFDPILLANYNATKEKITAKESDESYLNDD